MKKKYIYPILFLSGILSGYILIISVGCMYSLDRNFTIIKFLIHLTKDYELLFLGKFIIYAIGTILLTITSIPIFFIFGFILNYFFKLNFMIDAWINTIGIMLVLLYYNGTLVGVLIDVAVIILLNISILIKTSKMIKTRSNT